MQIENVQLMRIEAESEQVKVEINACTVPGMVHNPRYTVTVYVGGLPVTIVKCGLDAPLVKRTTKA